MGINSTQVTSGPDREGYHHVENEPVYDGTSAAEQKSPVNVLASAAAGELIRQIGQLVGGMPPDPVRRHTGEEEPDAPPAKTLRQTLALIDHALRKVTEPSKSDGGQIITFPSRPDTSQAA